MSAIFKEKRFDLPANALLLDSKIARLRRFFVVVAFDEKLPVISVLFPVDAFDEKLPVISVLFPVDAFVDFVVSFGVSIVFVVPIVDDLIVLEVVDDSIVAEVVDDSIVVEDVVSISFVVFGNVVTSVCFVVSFFVLVVSNAVVVCFVVVSAVV